MIEETPSAFNEDKLQKIAGDIDIPLDIHAEEELKQDEIETNVPKEIFSKEEEAQMLEARKKRQTEEFK